MLPAKQAWAAGTDDEEVTLTIKAGAAVRKEGTENTWTFPNLKVESNSDRLIKSITVQFTSPIAGDSITLPSSGKFVQFVGSKSSNVSINVTEGATPDEWAEYLRKNLEITLVGIDTKSIRMIAGFDPVGTLYDYNSANGHYYETVMVKSTWEQAFLAAQKKTYMGMQGYLVTVTSQDEHDYVYTMINQNCWMGMTCWDTYTAPVRGTYADFYKEKIGLDTGTMTTTQPGSSVYFFWVSGPEAGKLCSYGALKATTAAPDPDTGEVMFTNWGTGEPNNSGTEYCAHFYSSTGGNWNDFNNATTQTVYYVIEYGGMESDDELNDSVSGEGDVNVDVNVDVLVKVDINVDPNGMTITTEADDITVGQPLNVRENVNGGDVETIVGYDEDGVAEKQPATVERTYYQLKEGGNANRDEDWIELEGEPAEPGTYKVVSSAIYEQAGANGVSQEDKPFTTGAATFKIKKKVIDAASPATSTPIPGQPGTTPDATEGTTVTDEGGNPVSVGGRTYAKTYDGNDYLPGGSVNLTDQLSDGDQVYLTYEYGRYETDEAGETKLVLYGVELHGADVGHYQLRGLTSDGTLTVTGVIEPRTLVVTSSYGPNAATAPMSWEKGYPFTDAYANDAAEYDVSSLTGSITGPDGLTWPTTWPSNMLAPGDTLEEVLGEVSYTAATFAGDAFDRDNPQLGTYLLTPEFANTVVKRGELYSADGNYRIVLNRARLEVVPHPTKNLTEDGPITVTDKPSGGDPIDDDDIKKIIEDTLGTRPSTPGGVPEDIEPVITITKGGVVYDEIDPSEPGEYEIKVVYPDPEGGDIEVDMTYVIEKDPSPVTSTEFFRISTILKGATTGASITPSQTVAKGSSAQVSWSAGDNAYVALVEVDGKVVSGGATSYDFAAVEGDHEVVVTLVAMPVLPTATNNGFYTVTVNKYGGASGVDVSPSQVLKAGDDAVVTWVPQPGYEVTSVVVDGQKLDAAAIAAGSYTLPALSANHAVDVYFAPEGCTPDMSQTDLRVSTKIVGGPGVITGGSTIAKGDAYTVDWEPVIQTTPDYDSPNYAVYEVVSVKVNGTVAADNADSSLTLTNIREDKDVEVTLKPVLFPVSVIGYGPGTTSDSRTFFKGQRYVDIFGMPEEGSHISYIEVDGEAVFDETNAAAGASIALADEVPAADGSATFTVMRAGVAALTADDAQAAVATDSEGPAEEVADDAVPLAAAPAAAAEPATQADTATGPFFPAPDTAYTEKDGSGLAMTISGIEEAHKVVVYFAKDGETANPDTVRDAGNTITITPSIDGAPGTITGGGIINLDEDPTPTIEWELDEGYVPTGVWIDDKFYPVDPDAESFTWPEDLVPDPNHDYEVRIEAEKRVPGDDEAPARLAANTDTANQQFTISTSLTGGPGTITGTAQVVAGNSQKVVWTAGEVDGVKYRVSKVIIDGVERPDLLDAFEYTFDDVAGSHTIEVVLEPVPDDPVVTVPSATGKETGSDEGSGTSGDGSGDGNGGSDDGSGDGDADEAATTRLMLARTGDMVAFLPVMLLAGVAVAAMALARRRKERED